ncbi:MAG: phosphate-starvation-inducible PsiE family protein [Bacillota bacterium]|nr:phosphate-starvation-inducible PsiE family protein [Bacillota bacterium]
MENRIINFVVTKFSLVVRSLTLIALLVLLSFLMVRQTYSIGVLAVYHPENVHLILEQVVNFFLYFAFFSMILAYFKSGEYFQLRNLIYIGITGTLRFIIVNRSDAFQNLLLSIVILLLIFGYLLLTPSEKRLRSYLKATRRKSDE